MASQPKLTKGGLALVVNANYAIENIGREVTLVDYLAPGEVCRYGNFNGRGIANISFCTPSHLIPLNGGDDLGSDKHEDNKILEEVLHD